MEILTDTNTHLMFDGSEENMVFIYGKSGYGKTLNAESLIEIFHDLGYTILILTDVKDEFELAYAQFKPKKKYHLDHLRHIGKPIKTRDVKVWHPFCFNIPNTKIPPINFYGFSIKDLKREEWSLLAESQYESETIRLLLNASTNLKSSEGLYSFLHQIEQNVIGKKSQKTLKPDPKNFYLRVTHATAKGLQEVASYLLPFKKNYFLLPDDSELKLDWNKILNDNSCYNLFTTAWIDDPKIKEFCVMALLESIVRNKKYAKKKILIVINEIRFLAPFRPKGYKEFLANSIKEKLSVIRSMGRGMSAILDSQVVMDVDDRVRNSATISLYGELGGASDIERLSKSLKYKREYSDMLKKMEYRNSYLIQGQEERETFTLFFPSHCHAEPEYTYFEEYNKYFPEKMQKYGQLKERMKKGLKEEINLVKEKINKREKQEEIDKEEKEIEKEERKEKSTDVSKKDEKIKQLESQKKEDLMKRAWNLKQEEPDISYRKVGEKLGLSHVTAKRYIQEQEKIEGENNKEDFEDKFVSEEESEKEKEVSKNE